MPYQIKLYSKSRMLLRKTHYYLLHKRNIVKKIVLIVLIKDKNTKVEN